MRVLANEQQKNEIDLAWSKREIRQAPAPFRDEPIDTVISGNVVALPNRQSRALTTGDFKAIHAELLRTAAFFQTLAQRGLLRSWSVMNAAECHRMAETLKGVAEGKISPELFVQFGPYHVYLPEN